VDPVCVLEFFFHRPNFACGDVEELGESKLERPNLQLRVMPKQRFIAINLPS
jgi:hypothetical protein